VIDVAPGEMLAAGGVVQFVAKIAVASAKGKMQAGGGDCQDVDRLDERKRSGGDAGFTAFRCWRACASIVGGT
jgi:hypothetical protein